jgi:carbazole 1,9a-dioxygenase terminal dioxygenase component
MAMGATIPGRNGEPATEIVLPIAAGQTPEEIKMLGASNYATKVGAWLPCALTVDPWPFPGVVHNEYYVPRDANSHYYFQCGWSRVSNEQQAEDWANGQMGQVRWKIPVADDFTVQDAEAREGIAKYYAEEDGWQQEQPAAFDIELLMWRVFAGENARGIQQERHMRGLFKR